MTINNHIFFFLVTLLTLGADHGYAQQKMPDAFLEGKKLYEEKKYEDATNYFYKALSALNHLKEKEPAATDSERTILSNINLCYNNSRKFNIPFRKIEFDTSVTEEFYFSVTAVNSLDKDSAIITINEGKQDGIYPGAECYIEAAYGTSNGDTSRELKFLGSAKIIELSDYSAKALVKFFKTKKGSAIYPKDLLDVYVHPVKGSSKNMLYELERLNIIFNDNSKDEVLNSRGYFYNTDPTLINAVMDVYTKEITDFATDLDGYDDTTFTKVYKAGKFKGCTMRQVFHITSRYDIYGFFNFAKSFPGKYMGTPWKINETYATWVLNNAPLGEKDREWLLPAIESTGYIELDPLLKKTGYYIINDTLSAFDNRIIEDLDNKNNEAAKALCDKLIYISQSLNDNAALAQYYFRRSVIKRSENNNKEALSDMLQAYNLFKDNDGYKYNLASMYGTSERFDSSFYFYKELIRKYPENAAIKGYYGWFKTLSGNVDEAIPLCRFAYYSDTTSSSFAVNYGHTFLLKGNIDSAKYYYNKMLENLNHPTDYTEGAKKDFELFFSKGWQRSAVSNIAEWLDNEFNKKYAYITQGNLIWEDAKKYYDEKKYSLAIPKWEGYINLLYKAPDTNFLYIHNANIWIGRCFSELKQYDSTLKYYSIALQIASLHIPKQQNSDPESDFVVSDYQRLEYFYEDKKKNKKLADTYKILYNAEIQKVTEMNSVAHLHVLCIGGKDSIENAIYGANAKLFYDNIVTIENKKGAAGNHVYLNAGSLTKKILIGKLEEIRKQSKPEDIFIFYYSGITATENDKEVIYFNPGDSVNGKIDAKELLQNIDLIYAKKKMIITDDPDPQLLALITSQYTATSNNANEIIFLCPGVRTPIVDGGYTMFTDELVNGLTALKKKGQFSAKEFIDKASYALGRGEHYLPVLSFSYGKDFILYKNDSINNESGNAQMGEQTRGLSINTDVDNNSTPDAGTPGTQKNYALFFASDEYDEKDTWHQLSNPISDATALGNLLKEDYGFQVEVVRNATKKEIENKLKEYRTKNYAHNDQLMLFFAGHGIYYPEANMGYLVAKDSRDPRNSDPNFNTYLSYSDLGNLYLKNMKCRRIFLVLDACYAGSFFEEKSFGRGAIDMHANENVQQRLGMLKKNAGGKTYYKGISSGGKETVEDGKKDQHSPFAGGLIQMLNNAIPNYYVTADAIIGDIQNYHPGNTTPSSGTFNYSDPQGLFIFEVKTPEYKQSIKTDNLKR